MPKRNYKFISKPGILWVFPVFFMMFLAFQSPPYKQQECLACPASKPGETTYSHTAYTFSYNETHEQANWVAYLLTKAHLGVGVERSDRFVEDPIVSSGTASNSDYAKSGYDRGHLAPAADMSWSENVMQESFYFSNMSPQLPGFNRGIWKRLEEQVRDWAQQYDSIYIVTGPVLSDGLSFIGPNKVSIPKYYFKALISIKERKGIAFYMPNQKSEAALINYAISIDSLESKIGLDLFHLLPDPLEQQLESKLHLWP
ncbi:MAG: DNA/RNA non-specific endonuclease [Flavobacteriales bacterium]